MTETAAFRIGELSRRTGVSPELLRAWERRYGLLRPARSAGGLRLYSQEDLARVQSMQRHLAEGFAAAQAAALAARAAPGDDAPAADDLAAALARFDEGAANAVFDELLARLSLDTLLEKVVLPYLHELGGQWERGEVSVAQEHFASSLLRGRLLGLARGWGQGLGPTAVLACAPGEHHDLGLLGFGLALRTRGWRIVYLGADTPTSSVADAARSCDPAFVIVSAVDTRTLRRHKAEIEQLATEFHLCLGGAAAAKIRLDADVLALTGGPVEEAEQLTHVAAEAAAGSLG
ncbi:MAG TPA: MerR family transcriptional regulator [Gaiellaceae bacterium]|nr:MerR family transcriptional regulator [Gaiellaceae bacterium]